MTKSLIAMPIRWDICRNKSGRTPGYGLEICTRQGCIWLLVCVYFERMGGWYLQSFLNIWNQLWSILKNPMCIHIHLTYWLNFSHWLMAYHLNFAGDFGGWLHTNSCSPKSRQGEMWGSGWLAHFKHEVHPNIWDTPLKFYIDLDIQNNHNLKRDTFSKAHHFGGIDFEFWWSMYLHVWNLRPPQNASLCTVRDL